MAEPAPTTTAEDEPGKVYEDEGGKYTIGRFFGREVKFYMPRENVFYRASIPGAKWQTWNREVDEPFITPPEKP